MTCFDKSISKPGVVFLPPSTALSSHGLADYQLGLFPSSWILSEQNHTACSFLFIFFCSPCFWESSKLLHLSAVHFFLLLSDTTMTYPFTCWEIFGLFPPPFLYYEIKSLCEHVFSLILAKGLLIILVMWSYGKYLINIIRNWQAFPKWLCHFLFLQVLYESFSCSNSWLTFW